VAWSGGTTAQSGRIEMSRELMLCLNLEPEFPVEVELLTNPHHFILSNKKQTFLINF
jgi:hypothetical protein